MQNKNVLHMQCFVFGASGAGKSSLLQGLVKKKSDAGSGSGPVDVPSPQKASAATTAVNEISVTQGHKQRQGQQSFHQGN